MRQETQAKAPLAGLRGLGLLPLGRAATTLCKRACLALLWALGTTVSVAQPTAAWEFTANPVCTVSHTTSNATVTVTYDPRQPQPYGIAITRRGGWQTASVFALQFEGPRGFGISTSRHRLQGDTLIVTDTGFGNVLNGLEFNLVATARLGDVAEPFSLTDAAPAIQAFRDCAEGGIA